MAFLLVAHCQEQNRKHRVHVMRTHVGEREQVTATGTVRFRTQSVARGQRCVHAPRRHVKAVGARLLLKHDRLSSCRNTVTTGCLMSGRL